MNIYIVGYLKKNWNKDEETFDIERGSFEVGYTHEKDAINAMLEDYNNEMNEWKSNASRDESQINGSCTADYAELHDDFEDCHEEWWIDKVEVNID